MKKKKNREERSPLLNTKVILINGGIGLKSITRNSIETSAEYYTWGLSTQTD